MTCAETDHCLYWGSAAHGTRRDAGTCGYWWFGPEPGLGPCGIPDEVSDATLSRLVEV